VRPSALVRSAGAAAKDESRRGDAGSAGAKEGDSYVLDSLAHDIQCVDQTRQRHRGGTLLIVMPDRYFRLIPQRFEDAKTLGLRDVLQVDSAKTRLQVEDGPNDAVRVLIRQDDRYAVDAAKVLIEQRLALHHGIPRFGADISETENAAAVGNHRHGVPSIAQFVQEILVLLDRAARRGDSRGVPHGEVVHPTDHAARHRLHFPAKMAVPVHGDRRPVVGLLFLVGFIGHGEPRRSRSPRWGGGA